MSAPLHEARPAGPGRALPDTQQGMRRRNLARVMHTVRAEGPLSRAAVASRIGLTRAAVSTAVADTTHMALNEDLGASGDDTTAAVDAFLAANVLDRSRSPALR